MAKTERFEFRVDSKTLDFVRTKADRYGMPLSEFAIFCMVNADINVSIGKNKLHDELAGLKRLLDNGFLSSKQTQDAIDRTIRESTNGNGVN